MPTYINTPRYRANTCLKQNPRILILCVWQGSVVGTLRNQDLPRERLPVFKSRSSFMYFYSNLRATSRHFTDPFSSLLAFLNLIFFFSQTIKQELISSMDILTLSSCSSGLKVLIYNLKNQFIRLLYFCSIMFSFPKGGDSAYLHRSFPFMLTN